jgi:hypothetical protein
VRCDIETNWRDTRNLNKKRATATSDKEPASKIHAIQFCAAVPRCLMMIKTHKIDVIYLVSEVDDAAAAGWGREGGKVIKYQLLTLFETI